MLEKDNDRQILTLFVAFLQKVSSAYVLPLRRPHFDIRSTWERGFCPCSSWELISSDLWILQGVTIGYVIFFAHKPLYGVPIDRTSEHPRIVSLQGLQSSHPSC